MSGATVTEAPGVGTRRWVPVYLACGALVAWAVLAFGIFPTLLANAYNGRGPGFLVSALGGRSVHPVEYYLGVWSKLAQEGVLLLGAFGLGAFIWVRRRLTVDAHLFAPARLDHLALTRIVLVGLQLLLIAWPSVPGCSGCSVAEHAFLEQADPVYYQPLLVQQILLIPLGWGVRPDAAVMATIKGIALVCGVLALIGVWGRLALFGFAATATLLVANTYSYAGEYHHSEGLLLIALFVLAFAPSFEWGKLWPARLFKSTRNTHVENPGRDTFARWPLRLMQWLLALTYFDAGLAKLLQPGFDWFAPTTLGYYLARDGLMTGFPAGVWLSEHVGLLPLLAIATVGLELTFFLAILVPRLSLWMVMGMTALHVGIYITQSAPFPQHVALLWLVFWPEIRSSRSNQAPLVTLPSTSSYAET